MDQLKELREFADQQGIAYAANEPLKKYTSFHIGGPAALFCRPADQAQLAGLLNFCRRQGVRSFVLGMGTNVLFSDEGYEGAVISTRGMPSKSRSRIAYSTKSRPGPPPPSP